MHKILKVLLLIFLSFTVTSHAEIIRKPFSLFGDDRITASAEVGGFLATGQTHVGVASLRTDVTRRSDLFTTNFSLVAAYGQVEGEEYTYFETRGHSRYQLDDNWSIANNRRIQKNKQSTYETDGVFSLGINYETLQENGIAFDQFVGVGYQFRSIDSAANKFEDNGIGLNLVTLLEAPLGNNVVFNHSLHLESDFKSLFTLYEFAPTIRLTNALAFKTTFELHYYTSAPPNRKNLNSLTTMALVFFL